MHCMKHKLTIAGGECPLCAAEVKKAASPVCKECIASDAPVNSMVCGSCISSFTGRSNYKGKDD